MRSRVIPFLIAGALMGGCASDPGPSPDQEQEAAYSAVRTAADAGATDLEPAIMTSARKKLEASQVLIEEQRYAEARDLLEQATLDARLAESRVETQAVRNRLGDVRSSIESLQENLENQP